MKERKNIDRLYQEKFKDFEATPREDLWKQISGKLQENHRKKTPVYSLWSRIAGVAALLSFFIILGEWLKQPSQTLIVTHEEELEVPQAESNSLAAAPQSVEQNEVEVIPAIETAQPEPQKQERMDFSGGISSISATGLSWNSSVAGIMTEDFFNKEDNLGLHSGTILSLSETASESLMKENLLHKPERVKLLISTHAGPVYYGNLRKGNFLDPKYDNNSTEGEITYSYGFNIAYALNDKLKVRSGISKVSMSHNTKEIAVYTGGNPVAINNVRFAEGPRPRAQATTSRKESPELGASYSKSSLGSRAHATLNQKLAFIEVPVELEYSLIDQKISVNLIGGASTLFLDENVISLSGPNSASVNGEASNLNNVSFSTNIGLGFDYDLSEKVKLNLEPMFKYQLNAFDAASGTYQPFYLGIYTGFSYKF